MSNNQRASITSRPLFINVAESMVIFRPIDQLGCFRHSAKVTWRSSVSFRPRNGPPEAVSNRRLTEAGDSPVKHWAIALCSLSTGITLTFFAAARFITKSPAATNVSLFAMANVFPASMQAIEGFRPANPTNELTTTSAVGQAAASRIASSPTANFNPAGIPPAKNFFPAASPVSTAKSGRNFSIC